LPVYLRFVVWHHGKVVRTQDVLPTWLEGPTEITFALREEATAPASGLPKEEAAEGKTVYHAVLAITGQSGGGWFKVPVLKKDPGFVGYDRAGAEATVKQGEDFDFWAMYAGEGAGSSRGGESLREKAEQVEWAVVLRLCLREWEKSPLRKGGQK
jgi:hypothetical protein